MARGYTAPVPLCPNCNEDNPDRAKFCLSCGTALSSAPAAREVRKTVTVLFTDVTGSTALGERNDPEAMRSVMERYFDRMKVVIEQHGGTVEKFIGDAIMAVFGVPEVHEDDALRAVRAAGEMRSTLENLNAEFERERGVRIRVRTGINTGQVVAGDATAGQRLVTGDAVNVAARLEQAAQPDEILISTETYGLVRGAVTVEPVDPVEAKGKTEPVPAYRLTGVTPGAAGVLRRLDAPIVGREHELSLVMQAFERAVRERACHLFTILGSAGVGKSRLTAEVLTALEEQATILRGRCLPYGDGITFFPLLEAIPEAAGIRDDDSQDEARAKIAALAAGEEHAARITTAISELLDLTEGSTPLEEQFWAVRRLFEHLARQRPLVIEFDDIHWGEPTFLDLIEHIADWTRDAPILLVCLARHDLLERRPGWGGGKLNATSLNLEPLTPKECDRLVDFLLGEAEIDDEAKERIAEAAEGNPLFVEEMLSMLIDEGSLTQADGRWVAARNLSAVSVPPTIQALLSARIDRLKPEERTTLECAAVAGKVFWHGAVAALAPPEQAGSLNASLLALVRKDLIRQDPSTFAGEDAFRFRHLLVRDAAYQGIAKRLRADLHERFARWLSETTGDKAYEYEEILAYHYEEAYRNLVDVGIKDERVTKLGIEAGSRLIAVGDRAAARGDGPATITLYRRAAAALPRTYLMRLRLMPDFARTLIGQGEIDEASRVVEEVAALAEEAGNEALSWDVNMVSTDIDTFLAKPGATARASDVGRKAIEVFERLNDDAGLARAWELLATTHWIAQRADDTAAAMERALLHSRRGAVRTNDSTTNWIAGTLIFGPTPWPQAVERMQQLMTEHPARAMEARYHAIAGLAAGARGRFDEGRDHFETSFGILRDMGQMLLLSAYTQSRSHLERYAGDYERAAVFLQEGAETMEAMGERGLRSTNLAYLAAALAHLGRYDEAERWAHEALETGEAEDIATQVGALTALAGVAAARGDSSEAERRIRETIALGDLTDFLEQKADALLAAADIFLKIGRPGDARAVLDKAEPLYAAKDVPVMVERVRAKRAEIEKGS
ncbi:MAG: adenylate/guanylate cyclase domain-containing protein [Actinomycetota bacterium]